MKRSPVEQALEALGKKRVLLQIHDPSFPGSSADDIGRGTPYGEPGLDFARFARSLGFTGLQLGPQGQTTRSNPSPYDSTAFARNVLSISFDALSRDGTWSSLVDPELLEEARGIGDDAPADRTRHGEAFDAQLALCDRAWQRFRAGGDAGRIDTSELDRFVDHNRFWLEPGALAEVLAAHYGSPDWRRWDGPDAGLDRELFCAGPSLAKDADRRRRRLLGTHVDEVGRYALLQYLVHRQHQIFHHRAAEMGLTLYADLQVGLSLVDRWRLQPLFLPGYLLGAPPSRTNAEGQPWGYPILDPGAYGSATPAGTGFDYLASRARKLFAEFDGVRIDHPQGLVCPWVYRSDDADPLHAVQSGARLFSSPGLADHPGLARYAIARADQLATEGEVERHADEWVRELDDDQVAAYAALVSVIIDEADRRGLEPRSIACETLSTQPYPLKRVMERFGLGRFRVTQKMDVANPADVYRTDKAVEADWIMLGNHDTRPIWARADEWFDAGKVADRAAYLARRLAPEGEAANLRRRIASERGMFVHALFADLLVSRAQNVIVFFADLLGIRETYNAPGTVGPENWSLRVRRDYTDRYRRDGADLKALNLPFACEIALRSPLARRSPLAGRAPDGLASHLGRLARETT